MFSHWDTSISPKWGVNITEISNNEWSEKLTRFGALLPGLQKALPCAQKYKDETPEIDSDINVYDAIYYAGDCNAGSKTIAINLPNDERVRETKGSRKLQLKNSMQAKFDKILIPISDLLIAEDQRQHVKFDAFFENTMFHEVAHGLGLGNTVDKSSTVREALKDVYTSMEEGKADILGLWCVYGGAKFSCRLRVIQFSNCYKLMRATKVEIYHCPGN